MINNPSNTFCRWVHLVQGLDVTREVALPCRPPWHIPLQQGTANLLMFPSWHPKRRESGRIGWIQWSSSSPSFVSLARTLRQKHRLRLQRLLAAPRTSFFCFDLLLLCGQVIHFCTCINASFWLWMFYLIQVKRKCLAVCVHASIFFVCVGGGGVEGWVGRERVVCKHACVCEIVRPWKLG